MYCGDPCSMNYCVPNCCELPPKRLLPHPPRFPSADGDNAVPKKSNSQKSYKSSSGSSKSKKHAKTAYVETATSPQQAADELFAGLKSRAERGFRRGKENVDGRQRMPPIKEESEEENSSESLDEEQSKKIKESCENFLAIIHDNVLDTVQECIQKLMCQYFESTRAKIDNISSQLVRNECLVSKMYLDIMDKLARQNDRTNAQFKCLCQILMEKMDMEPSSSKTRIRGGSNSNYRHASSFLPPPPASLSAGTSCHKLTSSKHVPSSSSVYQQYSQTRTSMGHLQTHSQSQQCTLPKTQSSTDRQKRAHTAVPSSSRGKHRW